MPKILIGERDRLFILTGAGISAESGLPTFRGEGGLWRGHRVEDVASPQAWERDPRLVWEFYSMRRRVHETVQANPAHHALARLERELGNRLFLCTQNVDALHELAGSRRVVHIHGRLFLSRCDSCERPPFEDHDLYDNENAVAKCECGGLIRPHICWFGEMPFELDKVYSALEECTIFAAIGTSGVVQPAASFVAHARRVHPHLRTYYIGPEQPENYQQFDERILGRAGEVLPELFEVESSTAA